MSISIRNPEVERLLAEIKATTGQDTTDLLLHLLRQEHERLNGAREREIAEGLRIDQEVSAKWKARPVVDPRAADEILGYGEDGLPT